MVFHNGIMFERFSGQARHVVVSAQEEARELDHNYIGTEHLLLGLLTSDSLASASLNALGYTRDDVQAKVVATVGRGKASPGGHIPFTPRAKKVLELSLREALQLKHNYIGTEHILLGLLREGEGMAAQILADKHPLDRIRGEVLTRIESPAPREVHGAGRTPAAHEVLALAAELAGEGPVGSHHILEAILQQPDSAAAKVLGDAGIDLDQLAAKLDQVSIEDTADDTPQQAAARQLELVGDRRDRDGRATRPRLPRARQTNRAAQRRPAGGPRPTARPARPAVDGGERLARCHRACAGTPAGCGAGGRGEVVHSWPALPIPPP